MSKASTFPLTLAQNEKLIQLVCVYIYICITFSGCITFYEDLISLPHICLCFASLGNRSPVCETIPPIHPDKRHDKYVENIEQLSNFQLTQSIHLGLLDCEDLLPGIIEVCRAALVCLTVEYRKTGNMSFGRHLLLWFLYFFRLRPFYRSHQRSHLLRTP